jgi:hypothetical protein
LLWQDDARSRIRSAPHIELENLIELTSATAADQFLAAVRRLALE